MNKKDIKVAICFFGLTRSLKKTFPSIEKQIFNVLNNHHIKYDVYLHTYNLTELTNHRSGEKKCMLDTEEWKLLKPFASKITDQNNFDDSFDWKMLFKKGDAWSDDFASLKNAIRQLNSLKEVTSLWLNNEPYDYYIYLRPDLYYVNPIEISDFINCKEENSIIIPKWGNNKGGLNDRIAYGSYKVMKIYGNRIESIPHFFQNYKCKLPYHAEQYLMRIVGLHKVTVQYCNLKGIRLRSNGKYHKMDYELFKCFLNKQP